jgi:hypothetical protein
MKSAPDGAASFAAFPSTAHANCPRPPEALKSAVIQYVVDNSIRSMPKK